MVVDDRASYGSKLALLVAIALAGTALGLGTTYRLIARRIDIGAVHFGIWTAWPNAGTARIDPYARAIFAVTGEVPLAAGEGLALVADKDDAGRKLSRSCFYRVAGSMPPARAWTLTAATPDGAAIANPAERHGFAASDVIRHMDGSVTIEIAPQARPGNWLPLAGSGFFVLVLRLYDTSFTTGRFNVGSVTLPSVHMQNCSPA